MNSTNNVNHRDNVDTRPPTMLAFNRHQRPTMMCRKCGKEFAQFNGMVRIAKTSLGYCQEHTPTKKEPDAKCPATP